MTIAELEEYERKALYRLSIEIGISNKIELLRFAERRNITDARDLLSVVHKLAIKERSKIS